MEFSGRCRGGREPDFGSAANPAEFNRVFTGLLPRLHRAAVSLTGSRIAADDVVHDAYLRIARRPERFLGHPQPYAYAFTTMTNLVRDQWRRERRRVLLSEPVADDHASADPGSGGLGELLARWEVVRLLGCLTAKQARVVQLVDLDGYSVDEAAALLGLHRSTLAVTRRRALARLRRVLEGEVEGGGEAEREGGGGREGGCPGGRPGRNVVEQPGERDRGCDRRHQPGRARPGHDGPPRTGGRRRGGADAPN
ncbi:RNA polymerase sigma factor [Kitasatospora sp. NPDC003701]